MFTKFEWLIAIRYLKVRRQDGFISVIAWFSLLGIALGVATLIIVMSVMNGFRQELLTRILGINGHLKIYGIQRSIKHYEALASKVARVEGVVKVTPMIEGQVMATANQRSTGVIVRGISPNDLHRRSIVANNIRLGSLAKFSGKSTILVGTKLATDLGLSVGASVTLISANGTLTAFGSVPRIRSYSVAGLFEIGMHPYDSSFIFMPLEAAQKFFKLPAAVDYLDVLTKDPDAVNPVGHKIRQKIGSRNRMINWQRTNSSFFNAIQVERNVMFLILTLIIVVAAFNIISSLIMLVKDKGREIGILRTLGATRGTIMRIFFLSGASVGVIGTLAGLGLGLVFAKNIENIRRWLQGFTGTDLFSAEIYFLSKLPAEVDPAEVVMVVVMGLILSFLATIYPSWRAAQLDPIEALRGE